MEYSEREKYRAVHSTLEQAVNIADHVFPPANGSLGKGLIYIAQDLGYDTDTPRTQAAIRLVIAARSDARCWETTKERTH